MALALVPVIASAQVTGHTPPPGATPVRPGGPPPMMGGPGGRMMPGMPGSPDMMKRMAERRKLMHDKMVKDLKMTPKQVKQYDALEKQTDDMRRKMFAGMKGPIDQKQMAAKMDKMRATHTAGMKAFLTKDQFAKYTKILDDMRKNSPMLGRPGMMPVRPGGFGAAPTGAATGHGGTATGSTKGH